MRNVYASRSEIERQRAARRRLRREQQAPIVATEPARQVAPAGVRAAHQLANYFDSAEYHAYAHAANLAVPA